MRVIFVRHGEKRKGEADPELTSAGRRMAAETGAWLLAQGLRPDLAICTPTQRTRQTAEELLGVLGPIPCEERLDLPEHRADWEALTDPLRRRVPTDGQVLMVGHHPTLHFLADTYGPLPAPLARDAYAAALVLHGARGVWRVEAVWPGRTG